MFEDLKNKIKNKKLILFGELHGTKEIPNKISDFFSEIVNKEDFNVCLEIPEEFQKEVIEFMDKGDKEILEKIPFFKNTSNSDGKNSLEYIDLIKNLSLLNKKYNRHIKIFCMDMNSNILIENKKDIQNIREKRIAKNIIKILNHKKTFAILGDVHASKNPLLLNELKIMPAGAILFNKLREKMFSTRIMPLKGKFYNFGIKEIINSNLNGAFNKNFDYVIEIEEVTPCSFQKK